VLETIIVLEENIPGEYGGKGLLITNITKGNARPV